MGNGVITAKWGDKGASGISRIFGAAKLQSARRPGADNPRYAVDQTSRFVEFVLIHFR